MKLTISYDRNNYNKKDYTCEVLTCGKFHRHFQFISKLHM
jgi:hypothetical protein